MNFKHIGTHRSNNIKKNVLIVSVFLLKDLQKKKTAKTSDVFSILKNQLNITQKDFMLAVNFLFTMGVIEYKKETDRLEYLI